MYFSKNKGAIKVTEDEDIRWNNATCHPACLPMFKALRLEFPPYSDQEVLEGIVKRCCGSCSKFFKIPVENVAPEFVNETVIPEVLISSCHIILKGLISPWVLLELRNQIEVFLTLDQLLEENF